MLCIAISAITSPLERSELLFAVQGEVKNKISNFGSKVIMKQAKYPMVCLRERRLDENFILNSLV
jgi:hypothetical protein